MVKKNPPIEPTFKVLPKTRGQQESHQQRELLIGTSKPTAGFQKRRPAKSSVPQLAATYLLKLLNPFMLIAKKVMVGCGMKQTCATWYNTLLLMSCCPFEHLFFVAKEDPAVFKTPVCVVSPPSSAVSSSRIDEFEGYSWRPSKLLQQYNANTFIAVGPLERNTTRRDVSPASQNIVQNH